MPCALMQCMPQDLGHGKAVSMPCALMQLCMPQELGHGKVVSPRRDEAPLGWKDVDFSHTAKQSTKPEHGEALGVDEAFEGSGSSVLSKYSACFEEFCQCLWAKHECVTPGCKTALVMDGHLKVRRPVCAWRFSNWIAMPGWPNNGYFQGCRNRPKPGKKGLCTEPECLGDRERHKAKYGKYTAWHLVSHPQSAFNRD
jgi:hypothetical protein